MQFGEASLRSLRLCVTIGVTIHRLTQIFTDRMVETADFADSAD